LSISERFSSLREGFHATFWVANGMELFERLAYYGQATILSIYLRNRLGFSEIQVGTLSSIFGSVIYFLPIFAGTIADKIGFRRAFMFAFSVLTIGYFLIGSAGMSAFAGLYDGLPKFWVLVPIVVFTAIGGSFIKPSVLGTVALTTTPKSKSLGFAIYYWLVNVGAFLGPNIANVVRKQVGIEFVYLVSAASCLAMVGVNFFFYRQVRPPQGEVTETLGKKMANLVEVLTNRRFIIFLLIFSLYWIMFWGGFYIVLPFFVTDVISKDADFDRLLSVGALAIFVLQIFINRLTKNVSTRWAILSGFAVSSLCWLVLGATSSLWVIALGIVVWSVGEMIQAPRYYEYISDLAPPGQQALFQGYAFLPIAIAWLVGGPFGGWLYATYGKGTPHPAVVWYVMFGVGVLATVLMLLYNIIVARGESPRTGEA